MKSKYKNILLIGGSGFIGSHTADILSENGYNVTIFDKDRSPWIRKNQKMIIGDLMDSKTLSSSMKNIDCVYFFGGIADIGEAMDNPYRTIEINIMGLANTLDASIKNKVKKFIYASTMYVYSPHGSFYRATKQAAEILIEAYHDRYSFDYVFLRYGSLYGPRAQTWNGIRKFAQQVINKGYLEYVGDGSEVREYIHVKDAAKLSVRMLNNDFKNRAVTITGQQSIKSADMFSMLFDIIGKKVKIKYLNKDSATAHYGSTPYRYTPKSSLKITPNEFVDLGQGILEIVEEIHQEK